MKRAKIEDRIQAWESRLEVVENILSFETHPAERRRYQRERSRLKFGLRTKRNTLARMESAQ